MLTLFGIGRALKIITKDYKIFFNKQFILIGFLFILAFVSTLIALFNIDMYESNVYTNLYFIILISGLLGCMIDSYISF